MEVTSFQILRAGNVVGGVGNGVIVVEVDRKIFHMFVVVVVVAGVTRPLLI